MAVKKVYIVTDLGPGDGGKGGVVHKICCLKKAHTVVKVGGAQGSHGVKNSAGLSFNFSQFGCGTLEGVKTHVSRNMVIDPNGMLNEAELLCYECGIKNIFDYITVDENCLCVTPFHRSASRLRELARKDKAKGTVGVGVGEAVADLEGLKDSVFVKDLTSSDLYEKLEAIRLRKLQELESIISDDFWKKDLAIVKKEVDFLSDPGLTRWTFERFREMAEKVRVVDEGFLKTEVLDKDGVVVVESSHGVLTDRYFGFHPHTTRLRTLPCFTLKLLEDCGYDGEVVKLGVTRAYQIRHGAGPMVTQSDDMVDKLLPGSSKDENRFQGKVRVGPLDLVSLRYAIEVCGGSEFFDGLAVTWFDQILSSGSWSVCDRYLFDGSCGEYFHSSQNLKVSRLVGEEQLNYQNRLGNILGKCSPDISEYRIPDRDSAVSICKEVLMQKLMVPVRMISFGPTEKDKICL